MSGNEQIPLTGPEKAKQSKFLGKQRDAQHCTDLSAGDQISGTACCFSQLNYVTNTGNSLTSCQGSTGTFPLPSAAFLIIAPVVRGLVVKIYFSRGPVVLCDIKFRVGEQHREIQAEQFLWIRGSIREHRRGWGSITAAQAGTELCAQPSCSQKMNLLTAQPTLIAAQLLPFGDEEMLDWEPGAVQGLFNSQLQSQHSRVWRRPKPINNQ